MRSHILALALSASAVLSLALPSSATSLPGLAAGQANISEYYTTLFAAMGQPYHDPNVVILDAGETVTTDCGMASAGTGAAFYCPLDETIVLDNVFLRALDDGDHENTGPIMYDDDGIPFYVLAHEWGHHIQHLMDLDRTRAPHPGDWDEVGGADLELGADCYAGAWMAYADSAGLWESDDLTDAVLVASTIGGGAFDPHGSGQQRAGAVLRGFMGGIPACASIDSSVDDTPVTPLPTSADVSH